MTDNQEQQYIHYTKIAWRLYVLAVVILAVLLVLFVASDNEERFFYGFMTLAGSYSFRPREAFFSRLILKYTGVSKPAKKESEDNEETKD